MPECPFYLSSTTVPAVPRESPAARRERLDNENLQKSLAQSEESFRSYNENISFGSFEELLVKIDKCVYSSEWMIQKCEKLINIILIKNCKNPKVDCCIQIIKNEVGDCVISVFIKEVNVSSLGAARFPKTVSDINTIEVLMQQLYSEYSMVDCTIQNCIQLICAACDRLQTITPEKNNTIEFIKEQVNFLSVSKTRVRYSCQTMIFFSLLHSISPHAFRFLKSSDHFKVPSESTIRLVCSKFKCNPQFEQNAENLLSYVSSKFRLVSAKDKTVLLLMDEIHLKENLDYKCGNIVGNASNNETLATSACVFMITSLKSSYKEVVHILPVDKLTGDMLHLYVNKIVIGLEKIGFDVLGVVSDNHAINKKAMSLFANPSEIKTAYNHPADASKPLYFVIDTVHILKCIRNNWLNKPNQQFLYPSFADAHSDVASFGALKQMYASENGLILKHGYSLSLKSLYPSSIERQNVKLALNVLNNHIVVALRELGPKSYLDNWEGTANFIERICQWWDVVNVKTPLKGQRLKNVFQEPITSHSNHISFMHDFLKWLNKWEHLEGAEKFTKETHFAIKHSTQALLEMSQYCLSKKGFTYFLCGKVQTDQLEARFGKYRQLSGSQYHISVRQIFESEAKLRIQNIMPLVLKSHTFGDVLFHCDYLNTYLNNECDAGDVIVGESIPDTLINNCYVDDDDFDGISDTMIPLLTYISGYCSHQINKKIQCSYCKQFLVEGSDVSCSNNKLIYANDRGGLSYPHEDVVGIVTTVYIIFQKLVSVSLEHIFLQQKNQRDVIVFILLKNIKHVNKYFMGYRCRSHTTESLFKKIAIIASNIFLNNYTKKCNDIKHKKNMPQCKRLKLQ